MNRQGERLTQAQRQRVIYLLHTTELTIPQIGIRIGCSGSTIQTINRRGGIRRYVSHGRWTVKTDDGKEKLVDINESHMRRMQAIEP